MTSEAPTNIPGSLPDKLPANKMKHKPEIFEALADALLNVKFEHQYQFFCFFNPFKDFFSSGQHRPLVFAYCLIVSDQTVKIKVFHISGPLLPLVLHLLQVEANIPNILVHTNSAEQRDDFLQHQTPKQNIPSEMEVTQRQQEQIVLERSARLILDPKV